MAAKAKKDASAKSASAKKEAEPEAKKASAEVEKAAHDDHGHEGHAAVHGHAPNRKEYMVIFVALAVLTAIEVVVAQIPGLSKTILGLLLVALAITKAMIVALYYMHMKHETKVMKLSVLIPMAAPAVYAIVLISETAWRHFL